MSLQQRLPGLRLLLRGASASSEPIRLTQRTVFILPTFYGLLSLLLFLAVLIAAVNYGNNLAYALAFLLASLGLVSVLHTYRNLAGLTVQPGRVEDVFPGEAASFGLVLLEHQGRARRAIQLRETGSGSRVHVEPRTRTTASVAAPATERGPRPLQEVRISTSYPLGLVQAWSKVRPAMACIVYPAPRPAPWERMSAQTSEEQEDGSASSASGAEDFTGLREHHPGDSSKRMDWKALARGRGRMIKEFASEEGASLWFDARRFSHLETETALSVLTWLILRAEEQGRTYGLRLPEHAVPPSRGRDHRQACLRALALHQGPLER